MNANLIVQRISSAIFIIAVVMFLSNIFSTGVWAQCVCNQEINGSDATCTSPYNCTSGNGCEATQFTASCTGKYDAKAWLECAGGSCSDYNVCLNVYDVTAGQPISGNCHINPCSNCENTCTSTFCLISGHTYKLYVCLTTCLGEGNCPNPVTCTAHGKIFYCGPPTTCTP